MIQVSLRDVVLFSSALAGQLGAVMLLPRTAGFAPRRAMVSLIAQVFLPELHWKADARVSSLLALPQLNPADLAREGLG
jgi:hypothetical protein